MYFEILYSEFQTVAYYHLDAFILVWVRFAEVYCRALVVGDHHLTIYSIIKHWAFGTQKAIDRI